LNIRAGAPALVLICAALAACAPELDWRELSVPAARFSALLPCTPRQESRRIDTAGMLTMMLYACSVKQGTMGVAYTDYATAPASAEQARARLEAARDALLRNIGAGAQAGERIDIAGLPGLQVYAQGRAGAQAAQLKARLVLDGARLYQIAYVGGEGGPAAADIDLFLDSFKLGRCDSTEPDYLRQKPGVNTTSMVNSSSRPSSIAAVHTQVWKSLSTA
jgi:hypothetical protein